MLDTYLSETRALLQQPSASPSLYTDSDLTGWINRARQQIAGDGECIRAYLTLGVGTSGQQYSFSLIDLTNAPSGTGGVFNVRQVAYGAGSGTLYVTLRSFPWFNQYWLMTAVPQASYPQAAAQLGQGTTGSLFINLLDQSYTLYLDCACLPEALVDDSTPEAIPYPWTECVPFFAAFYAFMSAQRAADADAMMKRYVDFKARARQMSTPGVLPYTHPQNADPTRINQLGIAPKAAGR